MTALDVYPRTTVPTPIGAAGGEWPPRTIAALLLIVASLTETALATARGTTGPITAAASAALLLAGVAVFAYPYAVTYAPLVARFARWALHTAEDTARRLPLPTDRRIFAYIFGRLFPAAVAILPIHRDEAPHIFGGGAPVIIRLRGIRPATTHVLLYEIAPVRMVTGIARVTTITRGAPIMLAAIFGIRMTHRVEAFFDYTRGRRTVTAIELRNVHLFPEPLTLADACALNRAPHGAQYLDNTQRETLRSALLEMSHA